MNHREAVALCRYAKAACPQQAFDEYTPDAWADLLADVSLADAQEGLRAVVAGKPFVSPSEIRTEVRRIRRRRLDAFGPLPAPAPDADWRAWLAAAVEAVASGRVLTVEELGEVVPLAPRGDRALPPAELRRLTAAMSAPEEDV